jgi:hypothetical protein
MRNSAVAAAAAALLSLAAPARAQEVVLVTEGAEALPRNSLQKGAWSLSFALPGSDRDGTLGAWKMVGPRTNLGVFVGVGAIRSDGETDTPAGERETTETRTSLDVGVQARRYVTDPADVAPFLFGAVSVGTSRQERDDESAYDSRMSGTQAGLSAGVGVEWFPVRRVSISGQTGFTVNAGLSDGAQGLPDGGEATYDGTFMGVGTFTSGLTLQIYF